MITKTSRARARAGRARKLPLVLLLFVACRSLSHDGSGNAGDHTEIARGYLTASTAPDQALSGRIVVPSTFTGFTSSVSTVGEPSVGHDGSASYRIPIWVPDGVNGLQPSLAIEYNSEGGIGLLGPRWHLAGLSVITRCPKTLAHDGVQRPVDFFGDTFCMDGARLILVSGGSAPEFRTERESFTKIVGIKDSNGDFVAFTAYRRDGRIFHYGTTPSSRLHGNARQFFPDGTTTRDVTYAYYVDKIEDRYANSILVSYANAVPSPTSGVSQVQELEPQQIYWGGTGDSAGKRLVTFDYDQSSIPAGSTVDTKNMRWVHGLGIGAAQCLTAINVYGPDGLGGAPLLRQYTFEYNAQPATRTGQPLITGERVLSTVREGDPDNRAWKKTTVIEWEAGSLDHTRTVFNAPDVARLDYQGPPTQTGGGQTQYGDQYRRITAADVNGDGRDDVVYRGYVSPHHTGYSDCLGWKVRMAEFAPGDTSGIPYLGTSTDLAALGSDPDTSCRASLISSTEYQKAKAPNAYVGDIAFADLNGDGYPDIVSPIGKGSYDAGANQQNSIIAGYRAYLATPSVGPLTFGNPINFLDSVGQPPSIANFSTPKDATIAIGDTWGDGLPAVIMRGPSNELPRFKSVKLDGRGLVARTETRAGKTFPYSECPALASCYLPVVDSAFPDGTVAAEDLAAIDLDGDGTAEILRNGPSCPSGVNCGSMESAARVQSPTMSGYLALPRAGTNTTPPIENRWFLDLNGDGLLDVAWGYYDSVLTAINTGAGFGPGGATPVGSLHGARSFASGDVLVADFNLDGRQDLILAACSSLVVLLSDGDGHFSRLDTSIPHGDVNPLLSSETSARIARPNLAVDLNGDGLPDMLNLEEHVGSPSTVAGYIRQGRAPMMVTKVTEGTGRTIEFGYEVASTKDSFYVVSRSQTCDKDPQHLECLNRGRWLVKSLKLGGSDISAPSTQTFTYKGGVSDKHGRGFLGFIQRDIYGPGSRHEAITYDPVTRQAKTVAGSIKPYAYLYALLPATDRVDVDTPQGPNRHHYEIVQNTLTSYWQYNTIYVVNPYQITYKHFDCPSVSGGTCSGAARELSSRQQFPNFDLYGNLTKMNTLYFEGSTQVRTDTDVINYQAPDTTSWLLGLLDSTKPSTRSSAIYSPLESVTRTVRFTPDVVHGGIIAVEIEPSGDATTRLIRTFARDARGRLTSITDQEAATGAERKTDIFYENLGGTYDPDAVHVTKVSRSSGTIVHDQRIWRHPGLGFVVEVDDPNGLAAARSYDTFGRLRSETDAAGASTTMQYNDNPYAGADFLIFPEGRDTRAISAHLDSWGRETSKTSPVDATRVVKEELAYDAFGRVQTRTIEAGPAGSPTTVLNTSSLTYDDLNRLLSDCHLASDNLTHCATNVFDGRSVTGTNEAGRVVTQIADSLGRPSIQRAALQGGTSDATFTYGPFDLLEQEAVSDGSGQTKITYDVLGRRSTLTRTDTGTRVTRYNAFGDVVATGKQAPDGTEAETLTYGRDLLGRPTSITGPFGETYGRFAWDAPESAPTQPAPYAIGKLVDVNGAAMIHYDYGSNGLISTQTWTTSEFSAPEQVGSARYTYDSQGRLSTFTYPSRVRSNPLALRYAYDPYNGEEASITDVTDAASPRTPIWKVGARNELGQVASESMRVGAVTIARITNYYLQTAQLKDATLGGGANGQAVISYAYDADGLPSSLTMSGVGGAWTSTLNHDNLGQLTSWQPVVGGPTVTFRYDGDGNLTQRSWSGETVAYGNTATGRSLTVSRAGLVVANDTYLFGNWGRIADTPAANLTYDAMDQVSSVTEKVGGRFDFFRRDGFGNRILTAYGNPFDGQGYSVLYTLGDLYEFRFSSIDGRREERCRVRAGGRVVGEVVRTSDTTTQTATFFLTDNVGSVVAEASSSGAMTARSRRDPFGNTLSNASAPYLPADPVAADPDGSGRMAFGDHPRDANWGVVDMVSRFYSPRLGRFISPDAILPNAFDRQQHNAFAYVTNSPAALRDPLGFCGEPEGQACVTPMVGVPGPTLHVPGPRPQPDDGQDKYNHCSSGACSCGDHDCAPASHAPPPKRTDVQRLAGAPVCGPTSANATRSAGISHSSGSSNGELNETGTEKIESRDVGLPPSLFCFTFGCRLIGPVLDGLANSADRLFVLGAASSPAFNPSRESRHEAGVQFGQEAFRSGIGYVGPAAEMVPARAGATRVAGPVGRGSVARGLNAPEYGPFTIDSKGNVVPTPPGGRTTGSPDGTWIQARDAAGNATGVRIDGAHKPSTHTDPRALAPHGHVPGLTNPDGTPWLPINQ
jgi:RHS repeat-associated protein